MKKEKAILTLNNKEHFLPFLLTEWKTKKYSDKKVTFRFKLIGKKKKNGNIQVFWIENQKRGLFKKLFKRVVAEYFIDNEEKYNAFLYQVRTDWKERFGVERIKIYQPEDLIKN